jgi:hypothetical protein
MKPKNLIIPELKRVLKPPFAWVDRRLLFNGFLVHLSHQELLLYFFLVLASDRDGLSFYSYDKICQLLKLDADAYIQARNGLVKKRLIAFDGRQFQVLALPEAPTQKSRAIAESQPQPVVDKRTCEAQRDAQSLAQIFARLAKGAAEGQENETPRGAGNNPMA